MLNNSLTLNDLIETLTELRDQILEEGGDDDILVVSSSDYGDHCHTEQLVEIISVELNRPTKSAYSQSRWAFRNPPKGSFEGTGGEIDPEDFEDIEKVIVLRGKG